MYGIFRQPTSLTANVEGDGIGIDELRLHLWTCVYQPKLVI